MYLNSSLKFPLRVYLGFRIRFELFCMIDWPGEGLAWAFPGHTPGAGVPVLWTAGPKGECSGCWTRAAASGGAELLFPGCS